jgi:hypothetical protein
MGDAELATGFGRSCSDRRNRPSRVTQQRVSGSDRASASDESLDPRPASPAVRIDRTSPVATEISAVVDRRFPAACATEPFRERFEKQARRNLARSLARLGA